MDLATQQRSLLALIKMRDDASGQSDPFLQEVVRSPGLRALREIDYFWKQYTVEKRCPFTARLMKQEDTLDAALTDFIREEKQSAFVEEMSRQFLDRVARRSSGLAATLAKFELALTAVAEGGGTEYRQSWDQDPYYVLGCLIDGRAIDPCEARGRFFTLVSSKISGRFRVVREAA